MYHSKAESHTHVSQLGACAAGWGRNYIPLSFLSAILSVVLGCWSLTAFELQPVSLPQIQFRLTSATSLVKSEKGKAYRGQCHVFKKYSYQAREPDRELHNWLDEMLASF